MNEKVELLKEITSRHKEWWGRNLPTGWKHKFLAYLIMSPHTVCAERVTTETGKKVADVITKTTQWNSFCDPVTECEVVEDAGVFLYRLAKAWKVKVQW